MKSAFLICALAVSGISYHHPPINQDDVKVFRYLMASEEPPHVNRILLIGYVDGWIKQLRNEGWYAYGVTTKQIIEAYWSQIDSYHDIPFQSVFFKMICIFEKADGGMLFEMDRMLMPLGFVSLWTARNHKDDFKDGPFYTYEDFLKYLRYHRIGMVFHGMPVWRKSAHWVDESA